MAVCLPMNTSQKYPEHPSGGSAPMESHFSKVPFCTLQLTSVSAFSSSSITWFKYMCFQAIPSLKALLSMALYVLKDKSNFSTWFISSMTLQILVLPVTWPMEEALPVGAASPSGTLPTHWKSHPSFRTSPISSSGSPVGLLSRWWCPALNSQSVCRRPPFWHLSFWNLSLWNARADTRCSTGCKCPALFPLASSALYSTECTAWHTAGVSEFWLKEWILSIAISSHPWGNCSSSLETLVSLAAHKRLITIYLYDTRAFIWQDRQGSVYITPWNKEGSSQFKTSIHHHHISGKSSKYSKFSNGEKLFCSIRKEAV